MSYIELKDGMKVYGEGKNAVYAMNGMSLQIEKGELCVIMGASGSGKTTLLNVLGGLDSRNVPQGTFCLQTGMR